MKLHLPKMLTAALLAAFTVLAANTTVQAETTAPVYSGQIITWNNATNANPGDLAHGNYRITTYESGSFIVSSQDITGWGQGGNGPGGQLISKDTMENRNTLRFAADTYGQTQKNPVYTFNPLVLAGIIVDDGAEGYSISTTSTGSDRNIYLGNKNSTAAYSSINEDFTINKAHGNGKVYLRGTQTIDVASDKTYTINSNNGFEISGALTVQGGTLKLSGATTLASTITNNGTVNFNGTVSVADFSGFDGDVDYSDNDDGFVLSATYTIWKGEGNVTGLSEISHGGKALTVDETYHTVTVAEPDYTTYHLNTAGASVVVDTAAAEAREQGETLTTVNVKKTGATVTVNSELALPTLSIASGADATIDGTGTLTLTTLNNSGTVNVAAGLTMANAVNYTSSETPAIHVKDGGVLTILSNSKVDGAQIGSGTGTVEQTNGAFTKLFTGKVVDVQEGGKLVLNGNVVVCDTTTGSTEATMISRISELEIQGGFQINTYAVNPGTTWVLGSNTMRATDYLWLTNHQFLTVAGGTVETGELRLGHSGNTAAGPHPAKFTATNGSTLTLGGIGLYGGHNAVSISNSNLTFNAAAADANVLAKKGANANTDSTVTLADTTLHAGTNGWSLAPIDNVTVTVSGTTTVDLGGKQISLEGTSISGKFVFGENTTGTLLLSSADGSLEETLTLNGATVGFAGIWDLSALDDGSSKPTYEGGESDKNGYKAFSTSVTLADLQAGGSITEASLTAAEFYISDVKGTLDRTTGTVSTSSERDYTVFHVNEGTEKVSKAREGSQSLQSIDVKEGATLSVDENANLSLISAVSGATLEIASDKVLTVDGTATTTAAIAGTGTYALKEGSGVMVGSLADGWTGTVVLSHASNVAKLNLNDYGHENSKVKIDGVTAWLYDHSAVFTPELVLGAGGLTMVDGYSTSDGSNTAYTFDGGVSGAGDITFQHKAGAGKAVQQTLNFTGDVAGWTGSLNLVYGFTVNAQYSGEQTVNSIISRTGGTLNVMVGTGDDASVVTFTKAITSDSLAVNAGATANINGGLTTNTITVGDDATLAISGNNTTLTSAITSAGTVTLTDVALSNAFTESQGGEAKYYIDETQNYYMGSADKYLTVVTGDGAANATGTGLTWNTLSDLKMANGQVITGAGEANYSTLFVGGNTTSADIVGYGHKDDLTNIVVESGTLTLTEGDLPQTVAITVSEHGTISGDVAPDEVTIAAGAKAEFTAAVEPMEGIRFTADEGETVKVTNNGATATKYDMASGATLNKDLSVEAKTLEVLQADMYIINNAVEVDEIIDNYSNTWLSLGNVQSLQLTNLVLADDSMMQVLYKDEEQVSQEGTVTITESLVAGGATLYANLTLVGHELGDETPNLLYWDLNGAGANALTLGSTLMLNTESGLIQLDDDTMQAIADLGNRGEFLELVVGATGTELEYIGDGWFDGVFSRTYTNADGQLTQLGGDYNVQLLGNGNFGIVKFSDVPEPTTGTLSLLALAALAARRRKH